MERLDMQPEFTVGFREGDIFIDDEGGNRVACLSVQTDDDTELERSVLVRLPEIPRSSALSKLDVSVLVDALFEQVKGHPERGMMLKSVTSGVVSRDLRKRIREQIFAVSPDLILKISEGVSEKMMLALNTSGESGTTPGRPANSGSPITRQGETAQAPSCENPAPGR